MQQFPLAKFIEGHNMSQEMAPEFVGQEALK
jgi:hypothetical protein